MKKFLTWVSMGVFLFAGVYASITMARMPRTYDGAAAAPSVYELQQNPAAYDDTAADGAAAASTGGVSAVNCLVPVCPTAWCAPATPPAELRWRKRKTKD